MQIGKGENFSPEYLTVNPAGTVPSLVSPSLETPLTDSRDILLFLDRSKTSRGKLYPSADEAGLKAKVDQLIEHIHSDPLSTNILLFLARDESELNANKDFGRHNFLQGRQSALEKYHDQVPNHSFYPGKKRENGSVHGAYVTEDKKALEEFFGMSNAAYDGLIKGLETLDTMLVLPYAAGENVTAADFHIVPWLGHALMAVNESDIHNLDSLEAHLQKSSPSFKIGAKTRAWWAKANSIPSVKEFYPKPH